MKLPFLLRSLALLAVALPASPLQAQYSASSGYMMNSGSGSYMTMYYQNGPAATMHAPNGSVGLEVPI